MSELVTKARRKFLGLFSKFFLGGLVLSTQKALAIIPFGFFKTKIPARLAFPITISSNTQNYVLNTAKVTGYLAGTTDVTLTINAGVYVGSSSAVGFGFTVDTSWAAGDTVTIINNGFIVGCAGNANGGSGGVALKVQRATSITNNGTIGGGGGGGGYGQYVYGQISSGKSGTLTAYGAGGGGGGGQGYNAGSGGGTSGSTSGPGGINNNASGGASGTLVAAGGGGGGGIAYTIYHNDYYVNGGSGGAGGTFGVNGGSGTVGSYRPGITTQGVSAAAGPGGSAGACTNGNASITWAVTGTRLGALS